MECWMDRFSRRMNKIRLDGWIRKKEKGQCKDRTRKRRRGEGIRPALKEWKGGWIGWVDKNNEG